MAGVEGDVEKRRAREAGRERVVERRARAAQQAQIEEPRRGGMVVSAAEG